MDLSIFKLTQKVPLVAGKYLELVLNFEAEINLSPSKFKLTSWYFYSKLI